ncbi:LOW QUALITY PROTEIN: PRKR-interacting protein 1 homolog [Dermacentor silvarum]|uniref:LOW QUALITY PROTEIN: PRKR-interacting protein 1 homolog n=1 Tax=Dermacentor silvarum TaxID=543639 RepID=UPI001897674E|nr:LOW QUALITY PROTEIN: PRKR-interacting protein 1 homolog [Dermacentor silvarum]
MGDADSGELGVPTTQKPSKKPPRSTAPVVVPKNAYDVQRLKLERLMEHPERPIIIPEPARPRAPHEAPEFVRNVMGSSAGAGSGEFHVYRHLRRKEYARQKYIDQRAHEDQLDVDFRERVERNRREAEARTAKKRAKRQRRKQKLKERRTSGKASAGSGGQEGEDDSSEEDEEDDDATKRSEAALGEPCFQATTTDATLSTAEPTESSVCDHDEVTRTTGKESAGSGEQAGKNDSSSDEEEESAQTLKAATTTLPTAEPTENAAAAADDPGREGSDEATPDKDECAATIAPAPGDADQKVD